MLRASVFVQPTPNSVAPVLDVPSPTRPGSHFRPFSSIFAFQIPKNVFIYDTCMPKKQATSTI